MIRWLFPFVSSTIAVVTGFLIIIFLSIYIAVDPDCTGAASCTSFRTITARRAGGVLSAIAAVLRRWLVTQLIAMLTISIVVTVVLLDHRTCKAAFALGLLAGLLEFIPTVGPIMQRAAGDRHGIPRFARESALGDDRLLVIQFFENHCSFRCS